MLPQDGRMAGQTDVTLQDLLLKQGAKYKIPVQHFTVETLGLEKLKEQKIRPKDLKTLLDEHYQINLSSVVGVFQIRHNWHAVKIDIWLKTLNFEFR